MVELCLAMLIHFDGILIKILNLVVGIQESLISKSGKWRKKNGTNWGLAIRLHLSSLLDLVENDQACLM